MDIIHLLSKIGDPHLILIGLAMYFLYKLGLSK